MEVRRGSTGERRPVGDSPVKPKRAEMRYKKSEDGAYLSLVCRVPESKGEGKCKDLVEILECTYLARSLPALGSQQCLVSPNP
jgi:hypothetical protein